MIILCEKKKTVGEKLAEIGCQGTLDLLQSAVFDQPD